MKRPVRVWLALLLLAACSWPASAPSPLPATPTAPTPPATATASPTVAPSATYHAPMPMVRPQYRLIATLDFAAHYLAVSQQITYTNNQATPLEMIPLVVPVADELITITSIEYDRGTDWSYHGRAQGGSAELWLARPLLPGEVLQIEIDYAIAVPERPTLLGWTARQMTFIDWYPFIPPYLAERGWVINEPTPQGEYLVYESADFDVSLYTVHPPALLQIAAPAPETRREGGWHYQLAHARRFVWAASGHYQAETLRAGEGNIPVTVYYFEEERAAAQAAVRTAAKALEIYERLFGAYPYEHLVLVECIFPDGMESDGMFFLDMGYFKSYDGTPRNLLTTLSAHETAHNWWFGAVGNDAAHEAWLDEALATYAELLYYQEAHPNAQDWWWQFRVEQWEPQGRVGRSAYELEGFRPYVNANYLRGAQFLHAVRQRIGDEAFFAFLQAYATRYRGQLADGASFLALLQASSGQALDEIINEYFGE